MLMALGNAYLEKGFYSDAAKKYEQIIALKVANKNLYINLCQSLCWFYKKEIRWQACRSIR